MEGFLDAVGSREPLPAAGSVGALTGSASAGLLGKVCRVLAARKKNAERAPELIALAEKADKIRFRLGHLIQDDAEAYRRFVAARRAGSNGEPELGVANQVLARIADSCEEIGRLATEVLGYATGAVQADVQAAKILSAGARGAVLQLITENDSTPPTEKPAQG